MAGVDDARNEANQQQENLPPMILPQHGLTRYLRIRLEVDNGVLRWECPRTILGIVPLMRRQWSVPIGSLRSLQLRQPVLRPVRLAAGLTLIVLPWFLVPWWAAGPLLVLGLWVTLVSLGPALEIATAGKRHRAGVCFGHQFDADLFVEAVTQMQEPGTA